MSEINIDEIETFLRDVRYPARKPDLIKEARQRGARQEILTLLEELPVQTFSSQTEVNRILNGIIQTRKETGPR